MVMVLHLEGLPCSRPSLAGCSYLWSLFGNSYPNLLSSPCASYFLVIFGRDLIPKSLQFNYSANKAITGLLNAIHAPQVVCYKSMRPGKPRSMKNFVRHQSPPEPRDAPRGPVLSQTKNSSCNQGAIHDMVGNSRIMKAILLHDGSMAPFDHSLSTSTGASNYRSERSSQLGRLHCKAITHFPHMLHPSKVIYAEAFSITLKIFVRSLAIMLLCG